MIQNKPLPFMRQMNEAIHHWFCCVSYQYREHADCYTVTLPHLVGFRPAPNDPETHDLAYQQRDVEENVAAIVKRSKLRDLTYTIRPNGRTEGLHQTWFQFEVVITIPKQGLPEAE